MRSLFLLRCWYKLLRWSGRSDARPTEFAATEVVAEKPGAAAGAGQDLKAPPGGPLNPAPAAPPAPPTHIGRYEIKGRLGAGGLGEVFEAWDPLLSRDVAVKTLRLQLDPELRALLDDHILNEARAAAGLSHPNIVTVFDAGLCTPGVYIAMERLHGRDLRQALAQGWRPTPLQAAQLARRVAEALAYAHEKGVVHCDIKPGNIFIDAFERPKVLDFGIARIAHDKTLPASDEPLFGSPHYLAPEQLQQGQADARTDVRALGVVLYEMLTGRKAFMGDTVEQVVNAVLSNHPAPAHELREEVPAALSGIAARAMAHDPAKRQSSAEEMAAELRVWCERQAPRPSQPPNSDISIFGGQPGGGRRAARRGRAAGLGWAVAGGAVCAAAAAWLWWLPKQKPAAPITASAPQTGLGSSDVGDGRVITGITGATAQPGKASRQNALSASAGRPAAGGSAAATGAATPRKSATRPPAPAKNTSTPRPAKSLASAAHGAVLLSISPWGEVEVNGRAAGTTPPLTRLSLPAGSHTITVKNEDFPAYSTTVVVQADKPALVRHRFAQ